MVSELRDTALGMHAQVDEFADQYAENCEETRARFSEERRSLGVA